CVYCVSSCSLCVYFSSTQYVHNPDLHSFPTRRSSDLTKCTIRKNLHSTCFDEWLIKSRMVGHHFGKNFMMSQYMCPEMVPFTNCFMKCVKWVCIWAIIMHVFGMPSGKSSS